MGATDFLSGKPPSSAYRALADARLQRQAANAGPAGPRTDQRGQVLRRVGEPLQLSLFSELEPSRRPIDLHNRRSSDPDYVAPDSGRAPL
jgi:hypothetical protein